MARWAKDKAPARRSTRAARRRAAQARPLEDETCVDCRIHAARLPEELQARYQPPLGRMFRVRTTSGTVVRVCPRCRRLPFPDGKGGVVAASLVERGFTSQGAVNRAGLRIEL